MHALKNINPLNTEEVLRTIPGVNIVGDMGLSNRSQGLRQSLQEARSWFLRPALADQQRLV